MCLVRAVGSDQQSTLVVRVTDRALDDPALATKTGTVVGSAASDERLDAAQPELVAVDVVVVAAVGDQPSWPVARATDPPATCGIASISGSNCVTSLRFAGAMRVERRARRSRRGA